MLMLTVCPQRLRKQSTEWIGLDWPMRVCVCGCVSVTEITWHISSIFCVEITIVMTSSMCVRVCVFKTTLCSASNWKKSEVVVVLPWKDDQIIQIISESAHLFSNGVMSTSRAFIMKRLHVFFSRLQHSNTLERSVMEINILIFYRTAPPFPKMKKKCAVRCKWRECSKANICMETERDLD